MKTEEVQANPPPTHTARSSWAHDVDILIADLANTVLPERLPALEVWLKDPASADSIRAYIPAITVRMEHSNPAVRRAVIQVQALMYTCAPPQECLKMDWIWQALADAAKLGVTVNTRSSVTIGSSLGIRSLLEQRCKKDKDRSVRQVARHALEKLQKSYGMLQHDRATELQRKSYRKETFH